MLKNTPENNLSSLIFFYKNGIFLTSFSCWSSVSSMELFFCENLLGTERESLLQLLSLFINPESLFLLLEEV